MNTNPYQPPRAPSQHPAQRRSSAVAWLGPTLLLLFVAYVIAALLTPADPFSSLLGAIPVFIALMIARWFGVRAGRRDAAARIADELHHQR